MKMSYKELFYISKELFAIIDLDILIKKINEILQKFNIKHWSIFVKPLNTVYYFTENDVYYWDNYNRNGLDWIEYENTLYEFLSKEKKLNDLLKHLILKSNLKIMFPKYSDSFFQDKDLFKIELFLTENTDITLLTKNTDLKDIIEYSVINTIKYKKIIELNKQDTLTGLYNYKEFCKILNDEINISKKENKNFSIIFIDIDEFKKVNDKYGHLTGSKILIEFGNILLQDIRHKDCITRYGGDEYLILLRDTNKTEAISVAKRLLDLIKNNDFKGEHGNKVKITASMGIATYPFDAKTSKELIKIADDNMYIIKKDSKNGVKW